MFSGVSQFNFSFQKEKILIRCCLETNVLKGQRHFHAGYHFLCSVKHIFLSLSSLTCKMGYYVMELLFFIDEKCYKFYK